MFFTGMAGGFSKALTQSRQEEAAKAERDAAREDAILQHLITSDDPEIASMALSGLLGRGTGKPQKGLKGFLGEMQGNPMLPTIRDLMAKGRQVPNAGAPVPTAPPEGQVPASLQPPPAEGGAALPARSPVEAGGRPMAMPGPVQFTEGPSTGTHWAPRPAFDSPAEKARKLTEAEVGGKITAQLRGFREAQTDEERRLLGGTGMNPQWQNAGYVTVNGQRLMRKIDVRTGDEQYFPVDQPVALQVKPRYDVLAGPDGRPHAYRLMPDGTKTDLGEKPVRDGYVSGYDPDTGEQYSIPAPAMFERPRGGSGAAPALSAPAPPAAPPAPPAAVTGAIHAAGRTPAPPAPPTPAGPPPPAPGQAPAPTSTVPRGAISRGRLRTLKETPGAVFGPDGLPQATTAHYDDKLGKYYDLKGQEFTGFVPGDMGKAAVETFATGQATIDKVDRAIEAIRATGLGDSTDPKDTLRLWREYRAGDVTADAFGSLTSLAGLAGAAQYIRGNARAYAMFIRASEHTVRMPTEAQAAWGADPRIPGMISGLVTPENMALFPGGTGWDSPAALIEKLTKSKEATMQALQEHRLAAGKVPERAVGGQSGPPTGGPAIGERRLINGQAAVWDGAGWAPEKP